MHPGSCVLWGCSAPPAILPGSLQMCQNGGLSVGVTETSMVGGGTGVMLCLVTCPLWRRKCGTVRCYDATASSFVAKVQGEVFSHFHTFTVEDHSSMRNSLFGLPERILYEQSPWYEGKWWACSRLLLFTCLAFFCLPLTEHVRFMDSSPKTV
jgi:hypothetical protein